MKVYNIPNLVEERVNKIKENAVGVGLDQIDYDGLYNITKTSSKKPNPNGMPDSGLIEISAKPYLIGGEDWVSLVFFGMSWLRISPVLSCTKDGDTFTVETENSVYQLVKESANEHQN